MIRTILTIATAACCATVLGLPAAAAEKPKVASDDLPKPCDVYGPGYKPLGAGSDVCIKIGVSVAIRRAGIIRRAQLGCGHLRLDQDEACRRRQLTADGENRLGRQSSVGTGRRGRRRARSK